MNTLFPPYMLNTCSVGENSVGYCTCLWLWNYVYVHLDQKQLTSMWIGVQNVRRKYRLKWYNIITTRFQCAVGMTVDSDKTTPIHRATFKLHDTLKIV